MPVFLDGSAHGVDPLPLLRVGRVVIDGERLHGAVHARRGAGVAQVGTEELAVFDHDHRGRGAGQLGGGAVAPQLLVRLQREREDLA